MSAVKVFHVDDRKMCPATDYTEIQHDEVEALRSIYMEEFREEEAKTGAWNVGFSGSLLSTVVFHRRPLFLSKSLYRGQVSGLFGL